MAERGSSKATSLKHEDYVADRYAGRRSPSSGASVVDKGDVRAKHHLIECKVKGSSKYPLSSVPTIVQQMEKAAEEAWAESLEPLLALRFYLPGHLLANSEGWVDLAVHILDEDAENVARIPED